MYASQSHETMTSPASSAPATDHWFKTSAVPSHNKGVGHGVLLRPPIESGQYTALSFGKRLKRSGVFGSMGAVGSALDNAMAESFFASLQTELLDRHAWPTRSSLKAAIFD